MESESSSNGTTENVTYSGTAGSNTSGDVNDESYRILQQILTTIQYSRHAAAVQTLNPQDHQIPFNPAVKVKIEDGLNFLNYPVDINGSDTVNAAPRYIEPWFKKKPMLRYLLTLLCQPAKYGSVIHWISDNSEDLEKFRGDVHYGMFRIQDKQEVARLWARIRDKQIVSSVKDGFLRNLRLYYDRREKSGKLVRGIVRPIKYLPARLKDERAAKVKDTWQFTDHAGLTQFFQNAPLHKAYCTKTYPELTVMVFDDTFSSSQKVVSSSDTVENSLNQRASSQGSPSRSPKGPTAGMNNIANRPVEFIAEEIASSSRTQYSPAGSAGSQKLTQESNEMLQILLNSVSPLSRYHNATQPTIAQKSSTGETRAIQTRGHSSIVDKNGYGAFGNIINVGVQSQIPTASEPINQQVATSSQTPTDSSGISSPTVRQKRKYIDADADTLCLPVKYAEIETYSGFVPVIPAHAMSLIKYRPIGKSVLGNVSESVAPQTKRQKPTHL